VCDLHLPGLNGMEFYQTIKTRDPAQAQHIIFITGDGPNKTMYEFSEKNQIKCLSKPFELVDLIQILQG
jgi:CheY-like chemotaxis protein